MTVSETVRLWFGERIATGAVARDTEAYNQVSAALPDLIERLDAAAASSPAVTAAPSAPVAPVAAGEQMEPVSEPEPAKTVIAGEPAPEDHPAA